MNMTFPFVKILCPPMRTGLNRLTTLPPSRRFTNHRRNQAARPLDFWTTCLHPEKETPFAAPIQEILLHSTGHQHSSPFLEPLRFWTTCFAKKKHPPQHQSKKYCCTAINTVLLSLNYSTNKHEFSTPVYI